MKAEEQIRQLQETIEQLKTANEQLLSRNMQLSEQLCMWYEIRQHVNWLKEEMEIDRRNLMVADLTDDAELLAVIETRLEESLCYTNPDFGLKELADLIGTTQTRIVELFRRSTLHKSLDDYLDYLRLLRSMFFLQTESSWSIAACAQEAGFTVIRSFNRKFQDAIGMTPHEFRILCENNKIE